MPIPSHSFKCSESKMTTTIASAVARVFVPMHDRLAAAVLAFLLLMFWGAWVLLIGFRPCTLSYLLWR
jgi:hypothetical protein